ncbi:MAG: hypothetical protein IJ327_06360 [Lachnospiraceae bacterium]|nr:hypothetical protein [Lachnospiraceae bacterium]
MKKNILLVVTIVSVFLSMLSVIDSFEIYGVNLFYHYSLYSNLLGIFSGAALFICTLRENAGQNLRMLRYVSASMMAVTVMPGLFIEMLINYLSMDMLIWPERVDLFRRLICPVFVVGSYLLLEEGEPLGKSMPLLALIPTIIYGIVMVVLNVIHIVEGPSYLLMVYREELSMLIMRGAFILLTGYAAGVGVWRISEKQL